MKDNNEHLIDETYYHNVVRYHEKYNNICHTSSVLNLVLRRYWEKICQNQ